MVKQASGNALSVSEISLRVKLIFFFTEHVFHVVMVIDYATVLFKTVFPKLFPTTLSLTTFSL